MPSALVSGLAAPLRRVQATLGSDNPSSDAFGGIHRALTEVSAAATGSAEATSWTGRGGAAAADFARTTIAAVDALADRTEHLGAAAALAADAVARARERLRGIVADFEARAAALEARLDEPGVADQLTEEAQRALDEANAVVADLRAELDVHETAVAGAAAGPAPALPPMPTVPMAALSSLGGGFGAGSGSSPSTGGFEPAAFSGMRSDPGADLADAVPPSTDPGTFGDGVAVHLPDGSTATAPNAVAASAVRHALTQLGVPYRWGGTTPGVGLDCSGLTQWAYREAGLDLPRLAQEQDIGSAVGRDALRPGDLAVWDGHVAMIAGNGLMVEAGDPVKLSPIRTTNAGQGFQGFWRPTA